MSQHPVRKQTRQHQQQCYHHRLCVIQWIWFLVIILCLPLLQLLRPTTNVTTDRSLVRQSSQIIHDDTPSSTAVASSSSVHISVNVKTSHSPTLQEQDRLPFHITKQQQHQRQPRRILFIHVGKTGGETIKHILSMGCQSMKNRARKRHCNSNLPKPPSQLSTQVHGYYHCDKLITSKYIQKLYPSTKPSSSSAATTASVDVSHFDTYLFTVRHPVDRIISWYNYVHPEHCWTKYNQFLLEHVEYLHRIPKYRSHIRSNYLYSKNANTNSTTNISKNNVGISCQTVHEMMHAPNGFAATFFAQCFPTLQDWSNALMVSSYLPLSNGQRGRTRYTTSNKYTTSTGTANATVDIDDECIRLAMQSVRGELQNDNHYHTSSSSSSSSTGSQTAAHLIANYRHYMNHTMVDYDTTNNGDNNTKRKNICVVRTEHLWDDLRTIDIQHLHGKGNFGNHTGSAITHGVMKHHHDNEVPFSGTDTTNGTVTTYSQQDRKQSKKRSKSTVSIFCCALIDEIERYMHLIENAQNLNASEQQTTIQKAIRYCTTTTADENPTTESSTHNIGSLRNAARKTTAVWEDIKLTCFG